MSVRPKLLVLLIVVALASALLNSVAGCNGLLERARPTATPTVPPGVPAGFEKVWEVYNILSKEFVERDRVDSDKLSEAAIQGMLEVLGDPYTAYFPPTQYELQEREISGKFEGIGAEVQMTDGRVVIAQPLEGSPAEKAGIRSGDVVLQVNDVDLTGKTLMEAIRLIRGPKGTAISLLIEHPREPGPVRIDIVRDVIVLRSVRWRPLEEGIAYLRITGFYESTTGAVEDALREIQDSGARGIVLDLRNNPGGLLDVTVQVTSQFLNQGLVLYQIDGDGKRTDWPVRSGGLAPTTPLVVLVNQFSASGAEVLTGALQDHGRASVVGTKTFGKGSVNILKRLSDGSGLNLTFARWYSPNGRLIEGRGLEPDVVVEPSNVPGEDVQLQKAVELLQSRVQVPVAASL